MSPPGVQGVWFFRGTEHQRKAGISISPLVFLHLDKTRAQGLEPFKLPIRVKPISASASRTYWYTYIYILFYGIFSVLRQCVVELKLKPVPRKKLICKWHITLMLNYVWFSWKVIPGMQKANSIYEELLYNFLAYTSFHDATRDV